MTDLSDPHSGSQFVDHLTQKYRAIKQSYPSDIPGRGSDFSRIGNAYNPLKDINRKATIFNIILGRNHFPSMPLQVQLDNIGFCNLRCPMCPTHGTDADHKVFQSKNFTMTRTMVDGIAQESFPYALQCSTSGIGEGLLHRDIDAIIAHAGRYGTQLFVNSNGTTLGTKNVPKLFGITHLRLSIDGALPETFEAIRKGARYTKVLHAARVLKIANDILPPELRMPVGINYSLCASTVRELAIMVDFAKFVGASLLECNKMEFVIGQNNPKENYLDEDYEKYPAYFAYYREQAASRAQAHGVRLNCPNAIPDIAPDRDAGPTGGGLFVSAQSCNADDEAPDFAAMVDAQQVAADASELVEKVLHAAIERHLEHDESQYQRAKDKANDLAADISEKFEQQFGALSDLDKDWIKKAPGSDTVVQDCVFLNRALYFMANGDTRPCCVNSMSELAGDIRTQSVKEIYQGNKLGKFTADFRQGVMCEDCRHCEVKGERPISDLVRALV